MSEAAPTNELQALAAKWRAQSCEDDIHYVIKCPRCMEYTRRADELEAIPSRASQPKYPHPCGLCPGQIESEDDLEWHGLGNCVPICGRCTGSGQEPTTEETEKHARWLAEKIQGPYSNFGPPESVAHRAESHKQRINELTELLKVELVERKPLSRASGPEPHLQPLIDEVILSWNAMVARGIRDGRMENAVTGLEQAALAAPTPVLGTPVEFHKPGQIPVNAPTCDKCGKIFLDCKCGGKPGNATAELPILRRIEKWANQHCETEKDLAITLQGIRMELQNTREGK